jgi:hypothetical protein
VHPSEDEETAEAEGSTLLLSSLQDASLGATKLLIAEIPASFGEATSMNDIVAVTLRSLVRFMSQRRQAACILLSWGYSWDCEIILRSFSARGGAALGYPLP